MKNTAREVSALVRKLSSPARAKSSAGYFKTGLGEYGEGDIFVGLTTPQYNEIAKKYKDLPLAEVETLLRSKIHEERAIALTILRGQFGKSESKQQGRIHRLYFKNRKYVNNWDLVDSFAPFISGPFLFAGDRKILYKMARSKSLWDRRIAIMSTFYFIRQRDFADTLKLAEILLKEDHDLIHKAVSWMIREVGLSKHSTIEKAVKTKRSVVKIGLSKNLRPHQLVNL